ncbi:MAG: relaxase/mobilization nuclease domain-containing protein [Aliarcobacter skirrowii]|uniref:relaxase/mobilization nuclease domain-containing protein n=1 Tax=Aliarcobacter skirrowii TaxID=28200 RepID=UPI00242C7754|nr:relaxase/mobilization nuclease domain-containing protein [Aliarcobacter skirrowii]MDD3026391.1 relaxase/mobilization nuclease domain-containing protein [Aliarcobacter skirrowii]MDD3497851.1 relaxase/mobilization nuclease domain-containing protein [Aliarcobacter skirrowii]
MIVGFSGHGTGGGAGPTEYMTDEKRKGREKEPPEVVRGDPHQTRDLIDSLDFKHKYTSGVLSFAPDEKITPEMEEAIIDRFEKVAFAGLEPDQYNILWVRHTHAGHHELHFVTPRVELSTGKSLNIKPPGDLAQATFDDFRSEINARYGLADPDDPDRARNVSIPDHELKAAAEALRSGQKAPDNIRELIDGVLTERAVQGLISSREDVLEHVKDLGFDVAREGKNYITVTEPESGGRWRLKGALYGRDFEPSQTIERAEAARQRDYGKPDAAAASRYAARVDQHIAKRAEYHQSRYPRPEQEHRMERVQKSHFLADLNRVEPLHRHLGRQLGRDAILEQSGDGLERAGAAGQNSLRTATQGLDVRQGHGSGIHSTGQEKAHDRRVSEQGRRLGNQGEIDDGTRKTLVEGFQAFGSQLQRAAERIKSGAKRLADDVRAYFTRESGTPTASDRLDRAGQQLERAGATVGKVVQHEQALERQHQRASRDYGMSR